MKRTLLFTIIIAPILFSCKPQNVDYNNVSKLNITGTTSGYDDSTMLVLANSDKEIVIDTTYIINNEFSFITYFEEPTVYQIRTVKQEKSEMEYFFFWVENNDIQIKAIKGNMQYAKVTGSITQDKSALLEIQKKPIRIRRDSLFKEIRNTNRKDTTKRKELKEQIRKLNNDKLTLDTSFIRKHPDNLHSTRILTYSMKKISKAATQSLYNNLSLEMKESKYGKIIIKHLELSKILNIGDKALDFTLPDLKGKDVSLSSFRDKYVLIEFWSSSCYPCRKENSHLLRNYTKYKELGFEIISITSDKHKDKWAKAVKDDAMTWITVGDLKGMKGDVFLMYNVKSYPTNYLIDKEGSIIAKNLRGHKLDEKLKKLLE